MTGYDRRCFALFLFIPVVPGAMLSLNAAVGDWWAFGFACPVFVVTVAACVVGAYHLGRKVAYTDTEARTGELEQLVARLCAPRIEGPS